MQPASRLVVGNCNMQYTMTDPLQANRITHYEFSTTADPMGLGRVHSPYICNASYQQDNLYKRKVWVRIEL